jgi:hypothetical protein
MFFLCQQYDCLYEIATHDAGEYAKAEESALSLDLKMERIKAIQQEILQSDIFKKLGESPIITSADSPQLPTLYCLKSISLNSSLAVNCIAALLLGTPYVFSMSAIHK